MDIEQAKHRLKTSEQPESVAIAKWPHGWVAHVRYKINKSLNEDISATAGWMIYARIERHFE